MRPEELHYKGRPISELTKEELEVALVEIYYELQGAREMIKRISELVSKEYKPSAWIGKLVSRWQRLMVYGR